jgi:hypothetical protein
MGESESLEHLEFEDTTIGVYGVERPGLERVCGISQFGVHGARENG